MANIVDPQFFRKPVIIETPRAILADEVSGICDRAWINRHPISREQISGHGPAEVIAVPRWTEIISDLEGLGYVFVDPITLLRFVRKKGGWPAHSMGGYLRVGTIWRETLIVGFAFRRGSRVDVENHMMPDLVVMMKSLV